MIGIDWLFCVFRNEIVYDGEKVCGEEKFYCIVSVLLLCECVLNIRE